MLIRNTLLMYAGNGSDRSNTEEVGRSWDHVGPEKYH